jgi:DNA-binding response OmpR family regulator
MASSDANLPFLAGERLNLSNAEVLLIDSQPESLEILTQMFTGFGVHTPHRANSMDAAKEAITNRTFSLIIVDSALTGGDGFSFIQWLRRSASAPNRYASVVLLMGHTRSSEIFRGRDCGANFVVRKPAPPLVMMQRILWLSRDKREFVDAPGYCGPDRRFRALGPPDGVKGRRKDDLSAELGAPTAPNLDQSDIDALLQPRRVI